MSFYMKTHNKDGKNCCNINLWTPPANIHKTRGSCGIATYQYKLALVDKLVYVNSAIRAEDRLKARNILVSVNSAYEFNVKLLFHVLPRYFYRTFNIFFQNVHDYKKFQITFEV